jgi:BirA family biotin operon repressor/biotin-[acetyl-CoA-carboxylase] ligase
VPPADRDARSLLDAVGHELADLLGPWQDAAGDAVASGVLSAVADGCVTLGQGVHVTLPDRREVRGVARTIASDGALVVAPAQGPPVRVTAGDVGHVRLSRV